MRVLLVEDAELLRRVIADELRDAGLDVVEASTGAEAQRAMESRAIDVLVADIRLPGFMDGWQVARYCREVEPDLPVIYVSGFHAGEAKEVPGALFRQAVPPLAAGWPDPRIDDARQPPHPTQSGR